DVTAREIGGIALLQPRLATLAAAARQAVRGPWTVSSPGGCARRPPEFRHEHGGHEREPDRPGREDEEAAAGRSRCGGFARSDPCRRSVGEDDAHRVGGKVTREEGGKAERGNERDLARER